MIRKAVAADRERVVELLKASREGAGFDDPNGVSGFVVPLSVEHLNRLFMAHVTNPGRCCFVYEPKDRIEGVLMAFVFEHEFGPVVVAKDTVWWIEPQHRGKAAVRMLDAYEAWTREQHCDFTGIAGMGRDPRVGKLLERRGYRVAETHYLKAA